MTAPGHVSAVAALRARVEAQGQESIPENKFPSNQGFDIDLEANEQRRKRPRLLAEDATNSSGSNLVGLFKKLERHTSQNGAHPCQEVAESSSVDEDEPVADDEDPDNEDEPDRETQLLQSISRGLSSEMGSFGPLRSSGGRHVRQDFVPQSLRFSTVKPNRIVDLSKQSILVKILPAEVLVVLGEYDLWVRRGTVSVMGATIQAGPTLHRLFAPITHLLPFIECIAGEERTLDSAELEIFSCNSGLRQLKDISPLFDRIWTGEPDVRSFAVLFNPSNDPVGRHLKLLSLGPEWKSVMNTMSKTRIRTASRVMICGPKSSGKSTFSRCLVNEIVSSSFEDARGVCYIDLDPGQPEFTPPGNIYLAYIQTPILGPSFCHPIFPDMSEQQVRCMHHMGALTPGDNPEYYVQCVKYLIGKYYSFLETHPDCPLVINSSGWVFGTGMEVLTELMSNAALTDLVYMSEKGPSEVMEPLVEAAASARISIHVVPSQPTEYMTRSAAQLRAMQNTSYFHAMPTIGSDHLMWDNLPLSVNEPLVVDYAGYRQGIIGIMTLGMTYDPNLLHDALNGSIVGVIALDPETNSDADSVLDNNTSDMEIPSSHEENPNGQLDDNGKVKSLPALAAAFGGETPRIVRSTQEDLPYLMSGGAPDPARSRCIGQALVRAVDIVRKHLELITPIPRQAILQCLEKGEKILLARGKLDSPDWALAEECSPAKYDHRERPRPWVSVVEGPGKNDVGDTRVWKMAKRVAARGYDSDGMSE